MKIIFGADHAGFKLKTALLPFVRSLGYEVEDCGAFEYNEVDDYPDFIAPVARRVSADPANYRGIVLGGSGQGEAMVANRFPEVRAVVFNGLPEERPEVESPAHQIIQYAREHNDSNILALGAWFLSDQTAQVVVKQWLETPFSGDERHRRRLDKIKAITDELGGRS